MSDASALSETILWRRLDAPGHDACRLEEAVLGWRLDGAAAFRHEEVPALLSYRIACNADWHALRGAVSGWVGGKHVEWHIERAAAGSWALNGELATDLDDCVDLDFGFTPATNTCAIRRLALEVGQRAEVSAAWLDVSTGLLERLVQRYERRSADTYWYESPRFEYAGSLSVLPSGFAVAYPGLWVAET